MPEAFLPGPIGELADLPHGECFLDPRPTWDIPFHQPGVNSSWVKMFSVRRTFFMWVPLPKYLAKEGLPFPAGHWASKALQHVGMGFWALWQCFFYPHGARMARIQHFVRNSILGLTCVSWLCCPTNTQAA